MSSDSDPASATSTTLAAMENARSRRRGRSKLCRTCTHTNSDPSITRASSTEAAVRARWRNWNSAATSPAARRSLQHEVLRRLRRYAYQEPTGTRSIATRPWPRRPPRRRRRPAPTARWRPARSRAAGSNPPGGSSVRVSRGGDPPAARRGRATPAPGHRGGSSRGSHEPVRDRDRPGPDAGRIRTARRRAPGRRAARPRSCSARVGSAREDAHLDRHRHPREPRHQPLDGGRQDGGGVRPPRREDHSMVGAAGRPPGPRRASCPRAPGARPASSAPAVPLGVLQRRRPPVAGGPGRRRAPAGAPRAPPTPRPSSTGRARSPHRPPPTCPRPCRRRRSGGPAVHVRTPGPPANRAGPSTASGRAGGCRRAGTRGCRGTPPRDPPVGDLVVRGRRGVARHPQVRERYDAGEHHRPTGRRDRPPDLRDAERRPGGQHDRSALDGAAPGRRPPRREHHGRAGARARAGTRWSPRRTGRGR